MTINLYVQEYEFSTILVCIDGSENSTRVAYSEISVARKYDSKIIALTVLNVSDIYGIVKRKDNLKHVAYGEKIQNSKDLLDDIAQKAQDMGVALKTEILNTKQRPEKAILEYSQKENVDLIVVGTGNSKIKKFLIGSVASHVIANAECTTMVVR